MIWTVYEFQKDYQEDYQGNDEEEEAAAAMTSFSV